MATGWLQRIGQAVHVLRKGIGDDYAFASGGSDETMGSTYSRANLRAYMTGTSVNWARIAGPLWTNSAFASCLLWISRNAAQAPPAVFARNDKGSDVIVDNDLVAMLKAPNPFYDWTTLLSGLLASLFSDANAYIIVGERDRLGRPLALWYCPHWIIEPARRKGSTEFVTHYNFYGNQGVVEEWPLDRVCHIRTGIDPANPLKGYNGAATIIREVATDVLATNYGAASLKNRGLIGVLVTPKESQGMSGVEFDPDEFTTRWRAKTTGDNAWDVMATDVPLDMKFPNITPDTMALDKIRQYPEARIASIFGLPPQVVGFIVSEATKTYANYAEAREAAWEECVLPTMTSVMGQIGRYFLPDYGTQAGAYLGVDISAVRPLQPDKDKLHSRVVNDYKAGIIDRAEARQETGREVRAEDVDVWTPAPGAKDEEDKPDDKDKPKKARWLSATDEDEERRKREAVALALLWLYMQRTTERITGVVAAVSAETMEAPAAVVPAMAAIRTGHQMAYYAGRTYGGDTSPMGAEDVAEGDAAAATQLPYVEQFIADAAGGTFRVEDEAGTIATDAEAIRRRAWLYGRRLLGTANLAWVATLADDDLIHWKLGNTEDHCTQCPALAAASPYTRATLNSLPGDGSTDCLSNCKCYLEVAKATRTQTGPSMQAMEAAA